MRIDNQRQALNIFQKGVQKSLPGVIRQQSQNFKMARIKTVEENSGIASVQVERSNEVLSGLRFPKGVSGINVGDICIVFSPDPTNRSRNYIIAIY